MASVTFSEWGGGLDLRHSQWDGPANTLVVLTNAYIDTAKKIKKRPCLSRIATLETGTWGLKAANGKLNTFYESGTITHADTRFVANKAAHPTVSQSIVYCHFAASFNGYLYASLEYADGSVWHSYFDGTVPPRVVDANCPHTKEVAKINQKLYAAGSGSNSGIVRMCATGLPRDWTTASDAGFISPGIQAEGSSTVTALGVFGAQLAVFFSDSVQTWDAGASPVAHALANSNGAVGTVHRNSVRAIGNDLAFLGAQGFRTIGNAVLTNNITETDVGTPIAAARADISDAAKPVAVYMPTLGQYWLVNGTRAYVYSYSKSAKVSAWSYFDFPVTIDDITVLANKLYARSGDDVYEISTTVYADDGVPPAVEARMYFQNAKEPGVLKQFTGMDYSGVGTASIAFMYNSTGSEEGTAETAAEDTRPGGTYPVELCAVSLAPVIRHEADEDFRVDHIQLYYNSLGVI